MKFYSSFSPAPSLSEKKCPKTLQNYCFNSVTRVLEKTDIIPFYEEIQSHYESTKLSTKLTRYTMGDINALGIESGAFGDFSGQNTNLATVLNTNQIAKSEFEKLPSDVRGIFNNNFTDFIRSVEDGSYEQKFIAFAKSKAGGIENSGDAAQ